MPQTGFVFVRFFFKGLYARYQALHPFYFIELGLKLKSFYFVFLSITTDRIQFFLRYHEAVSGACQFAPLIILDEMAVIGSESPEESPDWNVRFCLKTNFWDGYKRFHEQNSTNRNRALPSRRTRRFTRGI